MRTIVGISLVVLGVMSVWVANLLHFQAEADLLDKHPEWSSEIPPSWRKSRYSEVSKLYKRAFPDGRKIKLSWLCAIFAFVGLFLGWLLLVNGP